jgi:hypothetical protein
MKINYLYLDDEKSEETSSIADLLNQENSELEIMVQPPLPFGKEIDRLRKIKFDGLILDLRLDQISNNGEKAEYRALALAQELRTRATEGSFKGFPIIMCSTDDRINRSFKKDETGHDLFDARYVKSIMVEDSWRVANELQCMAVGYKKIATIKKNSKTKVDLTKLFSVSQKEAEAVDKRLTSYFATTDGKLPDHEYARLILREMIHTPGVLINEDLLAARLGVDRKKSKDWSRLLEKLNKCYYKGVFHEAWSRWWMHLLNQWWTSLKDCPASLSYLEASDRVEFLIKATKLKNLQSLDPVKNNYSKKFWTICRGSDRPIDPIDGFVIDGKSPEPWQDKQYISVDAALKRMKYKEGVRVHPLEEDRFNIIKKETKR